MSDTNQAKIDVMNDYAHALDNRDWSLFGSVFTDDAVFVARQYLENSVPGEDFMTLEGKDTIVATIRKTWEGLSATHHLLSNYVVKPSVEGEPVKASCYMRAHHVGNRERSHLFEESLGRFDFEFVQEGGAWKIRRMEENIFVMLGTADAFAPPDA